MGAEQAVGHDLNCDHDPSIFNSCSVCVSKICYWSVMSLEHDARPARSAGGVSANRAGIRLVTLMFNTSTLAFKSIHAYYHVCTEKLIY